MMQPPLIVQIKESIWHGFDILINPTINWETLIVTLRGSIVRYSKKKKRLHKKEILLLETIIKKLNDKIRMWKLT